MITTKFAAAVVTATIVLTGAGLAYGQVSLDKSPATTTEHDIESSGAMRSMKNPRPAPAPAAAAAPAYTPAPVTAAAPAPMASPPVMANSPMDEPMAKADRN